MSETTFKAFERAGWHERAPVYDAWIGERTRAAVAPLVDAVGVAPGVRVLDLCCGPGYNAGEAAARGATVRGLDLAPAMVAEAARRYPGIAFAVGDAEALELPDASVDGVICGFGMLHLAEPERALAEIFRVLAPGGRFAWTVWGVGDAIPLGTLIQEAIKTHGNPNVALPPSPPRDLFGSEANARAALERAGFTGVTRSDIPIAFRAPDAGYVWEWYNRATVRTAGTLRLQTPEALSRIEAAVLSGAARFAGADGSIVAPNDAIMYAARKPENRR